MSAVRDWLEEIGLAQYADAFEANDIDTDLLTQIDDQVLKDIGVSSVGHRLRLRNAMAKLAPTSITERISEVPASPPPSQAERRQLTVMFCDLVGSTALSTRFDPEELREEIRAYQNTVSGVVARYDGFVAKFMGDGVLAYFGYRRAHKDDAERAMRAGLEIAAAVRSLETRGTEPLAVRIGIATGLVVVGNLVGEGSAQEQRQCPLLLALRAEVERRETVTAGKRQHLRDQTRGRPVPLRHRPAPPACRALLRSHRGGRTAYCSQSVLLAPRPGPFRRGGDAAGQNATFMIGYM